jgi:glycosyltransferase involved in cell wall biosynthesis
MPDVSVVISTFDQPNALTFAILGFCRQTFKDFELVIADDGSDETTKKIIEEFQGKAPFPIKHVWQKNAGFRKAKIMNQGVKVSEGRILVFSDGDCIPHRDMVKLHVEHCTPGSFCTGATVDISAEESARLTRESVSRGDHEAILTLKWRAWGHWIQFKNWWGLVIGKITQPKIYGRNFSVSRELYFAINGLDENFDGFSKEDSDIRNRMRRYGARPVSLWHRSWVFHVNDTADPIRKVPRIRRTKNLEYYKRPDIPIRCLNGLEKLESSTAPKGDVQARAEKM